MIEVLLDFARQAGDLMENRQQKMHDLGNKEANVASVVTDVDIKISDLFEQTVQSHFADLNYMIIDEEKITRYHGDIFDKIAQTDYQFVIDPIDGTIQYAHGHPLYGLTIGVYKKGIPLLGVIYMPKLQELMYCDEHKAYRVKNAFTPQAEKTELLPLQKANAPIIFGHTWYWRPSKNFSTDKALLLNYFSAVSQTFYPLIGEAIACCLHAHLWDIAGALPIARRLGFKIFEYNSDRVYDVLSPEYFTEDMHTKNPCVLCRPQDLAQIRDLIEINIA